MREARNQLSRVVRAALEDGPQIIARRGQPVVQVMSVEEFERLARPHTVQAERGSDYPREGKR
jgi:prevent-host-death family protein